MDERKLNVIKEIVIEFVNSIKPVSSKIISEKMDLSPATIRAEMQKLTSMNYLYQPHKSAGRIPTDKGYRCYIDSYVDIVRLSEQEEEILNEVIHSIKFHFTEMLKKLSEAVSSLTKYITYFKVPLLNNKDEISHIELIKLSPYSILIIIVLKNNLVEARVVELIRPLQVLNLPRVSRYLSESLYGKKISKISNELLEDIFNQIRLDEIALRTALHDVIYNLCTKETLSFIGGNKDILSQPEFCDSASALKLLNTTEEYLKMQDFHAPEIGSAQVYVGGENPIEGFSSCSHIKTSFNFEGKIYGLFGIIGPTRMNYEKAISIALYVSEKISKKIKESISIH